MDSNILTWQATEFEHKPRSVDWYWMLGGITLIASCVALYFGNFLFAVFILLAGIVLGLHAGMPPSLNTYNLQNEGFVINNTLYPYRNITKFWIHKEDGVQLLVLEIRRVAIPVLTAPLTNVDIEWVRQTFRGQNIKEGEIEIPLAERIMNSVGF